MEKELRSIVEDDSYALAVDPLELHRIEEKEFLVDYHFIGNDIVFKFFRKGISNVDWKSRFPVVLEKVAVDKFNASYPKVQAEYIREFDSWWMKASDFGWIIDKDKFVKDFVSSLKDAFNKRDN